MFSIISMVNYGYGLHCIHTKKWICMQINYVKGFGMTPNIITTWSVVYNLPYLLWGKIKIFSNSNDKLKGLDRIDPFIKNKLV
jgi:hypothetical protein